ncbi:MAG: M20/M25/M40 family metallo-hydrolase, partial [Deltaproteobacteria bacterium]
MPPARSSDPLPPLPIDWDEVEREATDLLQRYIRIDTTNPPGGEEAGAQLLAEALRGDGVEPRFYDAGDGRISLSARLPGTNGAGTKPLILLSHLDVVPAEREYWREDPYSGALKDGVLWGRGALDMKGLGVMQLLVFLLLKRHRARHRRDILLLAVADEEAGSRFGMGWLAERHPELLRADGVICEGAFGFGELLGRRGLVFGVATTEKGPLWLRLTSQGRPGHGSVPHADNGAARLARALTRILGAEPTVRLRPEMECTLATLREAGMLPDGIDVRDPAVLAAIASGNDLVRALVTNTVSLTTIRAGSKP